METLITQAFEAASACHMILIDSVCIVAESKFGADLPHNDVID